MQHATGRVERPGESQEALEGKKAVLLSLQTTEPATQAQTCSAWIQQSQVSQHICLENRRVAVKHKISLLQDYVCNLSHTQQALEATCTSLQRTELLSGIDKTFGHYAQLVFA